MSETFFKETIEQTIKQAVTIAFDYEEDDTIKDIEKEFNEIQTIVDAQKDRAKLVNKDITKKIYTHLEKCFMQINRNTTGSVINKNIAYHILTTLTFDIIFEKCEKITKIEEKQDRFNALGGFIEQYSEFIEDFIKYYIANDNNEQLNTENFQKILQIREKLRENFKNTKDLFETNAIIDIVIGCVVDEYLNQSRKTEIITLFEEEKYSELCKKLLEKIENRKNSNNLKDSIDTFKFTLEQKDIIEKEQKEEKKVELPVKKVEEEIKKNNNQPPKQQDPVQQPVGGDDNEKDDVEEDNEEEEIKENEEKKEEVVEKQQNQQQKEVKEVLQNMEQASENFETEMDVVIIESLTYEKLDKNQKHIYNNIESFTLLSFNKLGKDNDTKTNKLVEVINLLEKDKRKVSYKHIVNFIDKDDLINKNDLFNKCKSNEAFCLCFAQKQLLNKNIKLTKKDNKLIIEKNSNKITLNIEENEHFLDCLEKKCNSQEEIASFEDRVILNAVKSELFNSISINK